MGRDYNYTLLDKDIGNSGRYCKSCGIPLATVEDTLCEGCDDG